MAERADVSSIEAIEFFRSKLILFIAASRPALDEVSSDVLRTRMWLEGEQRVHWETQLKKRRRQLEEAQQAIFSTRMSNLNEEVSVAQQMTARRAKAAMDEATEKLRAIKYWEREYGTLVDPLVKQMEKLQTLLSHDMPLGVAYLTEVIKLLQDYADISRPTGTPPAQTPPSDPAAGGAPG